MVNAPVADPLLAGLAWHVADPLDLRSMAAASDALLGRARLPGLLPAGPGHHPRRPDPPAGDRRPLDPSEHGRAGRTREPDDGPPRGRLDRRAGPGGGRLLAFEIEANAFCHQMVRSLVGHPGRRGPGPQAPSDMLCILRSADRQQAAQPAPPQGLTLMAVRYGARAGLPDGPDWP